MFARMLFVLSTLSLVVGLCVSAPAQVGIPPAINCQGILVDDTGAPLPGPVSIIFAIWNHPEIGDSLWSEQVDIFPDDLGRFDALLGTAVPIPDTAFTGESFLSMQVVGYSEMSPRQQLVSVAYAYKAGLANEAFVSFNAAPWSVNTDAIIDGTIELQDIGPNGATEGQVIKRGPSGWAIADDESGGGGDEDWIQFGNILHTFGEWGIARAGNVLYGDNDSTHINLGVACTTGIVGQNWAYATVSGGFGNTASSQWATVGGGDYNVASAGSATVGGGSQNTASGGSATVGGGNLNTAGLSATVGGGYSNTASGVNATVGGGNTNAASGYWATVAGGLGNTADGDSSCIGGGSRNTAGGTNATVGGGHHNEADDWATVSGGTDNTANGYYSTVGGGYGNTTHGNNATVGGGHRNAANGEDATVGGGNFNTASGYEATVGGGYENEASGHCAAVAGGNFNMARGKGAFVGGGGSDYDSDSNSALGNHSAILGGLGNIADGDSSFIGGGARNTASGENATVGGGHSNVASGEDATVGGGYDNTASNDNATVSGGHSNNASAIDATVGGGSGNTAGGYAAIVDGGLINAANLDYSTVGGGCYNTADGSYSTVVGGTMNIASGSSTIVGGSFNAASGQNATVPGGQGNVASGRFSFAAGQRAQALHAGSFVWADSTDSDFVSLWDNEFAIQASNGVRVLANHTLYGALFDNTGSGDGVRAIANVSSGDDWGAVYASNNGSSPAICAKAGTGKAGYFAGDVQVVGTLTATTKFFKVDHPLDPENKYLNHACVESPEMKNIYDGNVTTDVNGFAVVYLPDYFSALNKDFRYQLTVIGQFAQAIVSEEISGNQFSIKTDKPSVKVSWQVTGIRGDAFANAHQMSVEQLKTGEDVGTYLHPEVHGKPKTMGENYQSAKSSMTR